MSDNTKLRGGQDRRLINADQPYEVRDWALRFGVTKEELLAAVKAVGNNADDVQRYFASRQHAEAGEGSGR